MNLGNLALRPPDELSFSNGRPMILKRNFKSIRRSSRHWMNTSVRILTASTHINGLGINLSDGGMGLFALANLPVGSQIEVEFLPPAQEERVRLLGEVRHRALYLYGIEFLSEYSQEKSRAERDALVSSSTPSSIQS